MKYLIVGCGRVGSTLAKLLVTEKHDVTVVDENPSAFKRLGAQFPGRVEVGTGIDYEVLKRAGADRADGFIAVTDGDNRNVMAALIAQRQFKIKKIVARIYDPPRGLMYRDLGIETVCPTTLGAKIIRDVLAGEARQIEPPFDFGQLASMTATVAEHDAGKRVADIERPGRVRVTAIKRGKLIRVASSDDKLEIGDQVNVLVAPDALSDFAQSFVSAAPLARMSA